MTDLEKYNLVNNCETPEELEAAILALANDQGVIQGKTRIFNARKMADLTKAFIADKTDALPATVVTRNWGLRQQAIYLKYYN